MRYSASTNIKESERGLWGDTFCIRWLAKWLDISIAVWSLTRKTRYLLFNQHENAIPYCILFHDANPVSGHYEPLVYQKFPICISNQCHIYLSHICKDIEKYISPSKCTLRSWMVISLALVVGDCSKRSGGVIGSSWKNSSELTLRLRKHNVLPVFSKSFSVRSLGCEETPRFVPQFRHRK